MTTIIDLAKLSQTSKSTVSRVITGKGYVSADKRKAILKAIKDTNYIPNRVAQNLKSQQTKTIGFIAEDYFSIAGDFLNYFVKIAAKYGYNVNTYFTHNKKRELEVLNLLMSKSLDGVFILTPVNAWNKILPYTRFGPIATWKRLDSRRIYSSYVDHYPIYMQILSSLKDAGKTRIGHILNESSSQNTVATVKAIDKFSSKYPEVDNSWQVFHQSGHSTHKDAAEKWLKDTNRPKTIICYNDYEASGFMLELKKHGFILNRDYTLVSFDDSHLSKVLGLTSVDLKIQQQAENSFFYLYNQLNDTEVSYHQIEPKIVDNGFDIDDL